VYSSQLRNGPRPFGSVKRENLKIGRREWGIGKNLGPPFNQTGAECVDGNVLDIASEVRKDDMFSGGTWKS